MKNCLTLALCANVSGDCEVKPVLVYHSDNPQAFQSHKIVWKNCRLYGALMLGRGLHGSSSWNW